MDFKSVASLSLFLVGTVLANYFFKSGAMTMGPLSFSFDTLLRAVTTPAVIAGVVMYGLAAVAWFVALSLVPLNIAVSVSALVYVFVILLALLIFKETIPLDRWAGIALVTLGMLLIGRTA